jgi:poly[(R)-3-hydroxyalkanoate] polymerase subunit PhaE
MEEPQSSSLSDELFSAQRKYWDAWLNLSRKATGADAESGQSPTSVADGLHKWWGLVTPTTPPAAQEFYDRMLALGQAYVGLGEKFTQPGGEDAAPAFENWLDHLQNSLASVTEGARTQTDRSARDALAFWDLPLDTWQRTVSSMLPVPGDYLQGMQNQDAARVAESVKDRFERFLAIPAVGYSREAQDQYQKLARLLHDYAKALQQYNIAFARIGMRSIDNFRRKLNDAAQSGPIDSLRKHYDLWVDACEEVYAEYVMSEEYTALYGHMVNALMAVKRQGAVLVDEALESMNIPTRREINTMHQRMHDVRRENHALRAELDRIKEHLGKPLADEQHSATAPVADAVKPTLAPAPAPAPRRSKSKSTK